MVDLYFDDVIEVNRLDPDGKKYDKVSRIEARSVESEMYLLLDVNTELYPINVGNKFRMSLTHTLSLDGSAVTLEGKQKSLLDKFEYVMHGLLYKIDEDTSGDNLQVVVYVSFGGLQLMLKGEPSKMGKFKEKKAYLDSYFLLFTLIYLIEEQMEMLAASIRAYKQHFERLHEFL